MDAVVEGASVNTRGAVLDWLTDLLAEHWFFVCFFVRNFLEIVTLCCKVSSS
jgi:hypothetical protein